MSCASIPNNSLSPTKCSTLESEVMYPRQPRCLSPAQEKIRINPNVKYDYSPQTVIETTSVDVIGIGYDPGMYDEDDDEVIAIPTR